MTIQIGAVVMASGSGSRFEGGNKLLVPFLNQPLVTRAFAALPAEVFAKRLVVTRWPEVARLAREAGLEALLHDLPDVSDTIRLGTERMLSMDGCLYAVGDQPLLTPETVRRVAETFRAHPARIVRAVKDGRAGNPAVFPAACFPALCALPKGRGGNFVMRAHPEWVLGAEAGQAQELWDVDTWNDYERLRRETL